jgi:hypothetical protein
MNIHFLLSWAYVCFLPPLSLDLQNRWSRKKSICPAQSGIALQLRRCGARGAFYETIDFPTFYEIIKIGFPLFSCVLCAFCGEPDLFSI